MTCERAEVRVHRCLVELRELPVASKQLTMRTRVESRIHNFLGLPYLRCHRLDMSLLVGSDEIFRIFEPGGGDEESPGIIRVSQGLQVFQAE